MHVDQATRPFTSRLQFLRKQGWTYKMMEQRSDEARSLSWFNQLCMARDPWQPNRLPPSRDAVPDLAKMMNEDEATVAQWIATEWYGVPAPLESRLTADDAKLVQALVDRLADNSLVLAS